MARSIRGAAQPSGRAQHLMVHGRLRSLRASATSRPSWPRCARQGPTAIESLLDRLAAHLPPAQRRRPRPPPVNTMPYGCRRANCTRTARPSVRVLLRSPAGRLGLRVRTLDSSPELNASSSAPPFCALRGRGHPEFDAKVVVTVLARQRPRHLAGLRALGARSSPQPARCSATAWSLRSQQLSATDHFVATEVRSRRRFKPRTSRQAHAASMSFNTPATGAARNRRQTGRDFRPGVRTNTPRHLALHELRACPHARAGIGSSSTAPRPAACATPTGGRSIASKAPLCRHQVGRAGIRTVHPRQRGEPDASRRDDAGLQARDMRVVAQVLTLKRLAGPSKSQRRRLAGIRRRSSSPATSCRRRRSAHLAHVLARSPPAPLTSSDARSAERAPLTVSPRAAYGPAQAPLSGATTLARKSRAQTGSYLGCAPQPVLWR